MTLASRTRPRNCAPRHAVWPEIDATLSTIRRCAATRSALEAAGIGFTFMDGNAGRVVPCGITYATPEKDVAH